ncbi:glucose 1-dehydrogenase [Mesorhizobium sp. B1-1-8]|uniref:glucose 1-dehydrogenase n=1 Tax=Mesorhizobium sp. B1-1-8 TaxID=2589976 RepID=UPI001125E878|nr:glucose 1-dehydrogenase [Mesorhizobium sp. B1-1-8]UCI05131.1 glucose 1-dehydrogenase [Mesorhizobium sp. B1-1-8]
MTNRLEGKIALVTGGSSGIGLATAKNLAAEGARIFVTGRRQVELDAAVLEIGHNATGVRGDAGSLADLDALFTTIRNEAGSLDILVANAGIYEMQALTDVTEVAFDKTFDLNVRGLLFAVQKALPVMNDGGSIVLLGSVGASKGFAGFSVYNATKAAVRSFARTWAVELKDRKIRVNVVSPGPTATPGFDVFANAEMKEGLLGMVPLGRLSDPSEIAKAITFLASADSRFITGIELFVDGGTAQV